MDDTTCISKISTNVLSELYDIENSKKKKKKKHKKIDDTTYISKVSTNVFSELYDKKRIINLEG